MLAISGCNKEMGIVYYTREPDFWMPDIQPGTTLKFPVINKYKSVLYKNMSSVNKNTLVLLLF